MRKLLLCLALMLSIVDGAFAETSEGGEVLSALESLKATVGLSGGILDMGDRAIDILGIVVPPELTKYWEGMRIAGTLFGTEKKSGENIYILVLLPLDGRTDMPKKAQAIYLLENTGKQDRRSGKTLYKVGAPMDFVVSDKPKEIPNDPTPKSGPKEKKKDRGIAI